MIEKFGYKNLKWVVGADVEQIATAFLDYHKQDKKALVEIMGLGVGIA